MIMQNYKGLGDAIYQSWIYGEFEFRKAQLKGSYKRWSPMLIWIYQLGFLAGVLLGFVLGVFAGIIIAMKIF